MAHHQHQHQIEAEDDDEDPWTRAEKDVRHQGPFLTQHKKREKEKFLKVGLPHTNYVCHKDHVWLLWTMLFSFKI